MKAKIKYIILVIALLLISTYIIYSFSTHDNGIIDDEAKNISINENIDNLPKKIKISKLENQDEEPFVCFVSDEYEIQELKNYFNSLSLNKVELEGEFEPMYEIIFCGEENIVISISKKQILKITKDSINSVEYYQISNSDFNKIPDLLDIKYYLHRSMLEIPSDDLCNKAQAIVLDGMTNSNISILKEEIYNIHSLLECHLVDNVQTRKNANSFYWEFEVKDQIVIQPNGLEVQSYGFWEYRDSLKEISKLSMSDTTKKILEDIIYKMEQGINNHDLSECFEAHKILHDLDYWVINYPISSFSTAPADWGGIQCYYGLIENYELD